ncbi:MAG: YerC/YecD family TrpR-related protein [Clostridia bacterium]|nr:YerC/YecD family TrpR-related protein [Clostridia bacterium]
MNKLHCPATDKLFKAILKLETIEECYNFFEDICTIKELMDMSQRLSVAEKLSAGKSYQEISKETGASTATISRVNKCLNYGSGGYENALKKLETEE